MSLQDRTYQRKAMANSTLTVRQRRAWLNSLMDSVAKIETAYEELDTVMGKAHDAGMSWAAIAGALGMHPTSVKEMSDRAQQGGNQGGS